jgi:hypothetical protein
MPPPSGGPVDHSALQHRAPRFWTVSEKVRAEFSLTALAYNIRRVLNLVAFDKLMAAVKAAPG